MCEIFDTVFLSMALTLFTVGVTMLLITVIDTVLDFRLSKRLGRWFDRKFPEGK